MAKSLNATVAYNIVDDWGYQQAANANVSQMPGMMGLLVRKEVDVSCECGHFFVNLSEF